ncbi:MAG: hypothetical protein LCH26_05220 [Proteobacteria bacterium]|nr:hypothetical protein [Pseudomonadota bacterium]
MKYPFLSFFVTMFCLLLSACQGGRQTTDVDARHRTATGACDGLFDGGHPTKYMSKKTLDQIGSAPHYEFSRFGNEAFNARPTAPLGRGGQGETRNF